MRTEAQKRAYNEKKRADRVLDPEKYRERARLKYAANADKIKAQAKARRDADPEKYKVRKRSAYSANPEKFRARTRAHRAANPGYASAANKKSRLSNPGRLKTRRLRNTYGLLDYDSMLAAQNGGCANCGSLDPGRKGSKHFAVDHCHRTGRVRDLLCLGCNAGGGQLCDDPALHYLLADYIERAQQKQAAELAAPPAEVLP